MNVLQLRDPNVEADQFWDKFVNATTELGDDEESEGIKCYFKCKEINNF